MVLEATLICIDNSEWMRNGDYAPSRFQAQADAVNLIIGSKTQANPENTIGVLTMAGKGVQVLVTPTNDLGQILTCMHGLEIGGEVNLSAAIQVAHLALKHRQNKNQQQRIIIFAGSPIKHEKKVLEMLGRKLKKNSVALDIVNFGEDDEGKTEKLEALLAAVNNNGTSHNVHVPAGPTVLSDAIISTPIITGDEEGGSGFAAATAAAAAGGSANFEFGVDPNLDPELALALRASMEEERARQESAAKKATEDAAKQEQVSLQDTISEDALLQQALAMSMEEERARQEAAANKAAEDAAKQEQASSQDAIMTEATSTATSEDDEDALLQQALAMSMEEESARQEAAAKKAAEDAAKQEQAGSQDATMAEATSAATSEDDEDDLLQQALAMSMEGNKDT